MRGSRLRPAGTLGSVWQKVPDTVSEKVARSFKYQHVAMTAANIWVKPNFNHALFALAFFSRRQDRELLGAISLGILEKLNRTIPLRLQSSAAEYNAHEFRAIPILPGEQLASQAQSSR
jgi:hypothetical protein